MRKIKEDRGIAGYEFSPSKSGKFPKISRVVDITTYPREKGGKEKKIVRTVDNTNMKPGELNTAKAAYLALKDRKCTDYVNKRFCAEPEPDVVPKGDGGVEIHPDNNAKPFKISNTEIGKLLSKVENCRKSAKNLLDEAEAKEHIVTFCYLPKMNIQYDNPSEEGWLDDGFIWEGIGQRKVDSAINDLLEYDRKEGIDLAEYVDDDLKGIVKTIKMEWQSEPEELLLVHCTVVTNNVKSIIKPLQSYLGGQMSDGWGEGFEQQTLGSTTYYTVYDENDDGGYQEMYFYDSSDYRYAEQKVQELNDEANENCREYNDETEEWEDGESDEHWDYYESRASISYSFWPDSKCLQSILIDGYSAEGFDAKGFDKEGFDRFGKDKDGYNREGFKKGWDGVARDRDGYDETGFDRDGKDREGFDKEGFKDLNNKRPTNKAGKEQGAVLKTNKDGKVFVKNTFDMGESRNRKDIEYRHLHESYPSTIDRAVTNVHAFYWDDEELQNAECPEDVKAWFETLDIANTLDGDQILEVSRRIFDDLVAESGWGNDQINESEETSDKPNLQTIVGNVVGYLSKTGTESDQVVAQRLMDMLNCYEATGKESDVERLHDEIRRQGLANYLEESIEDDFDEDDFDDEDDGEYHHPNADGCSCGCGKRYTMSLESFLLKDGYDKDFDLEEIGDILDMDLGELICEDCYADLKKEFEPKLYSEYNDLGIDTRTGEPFGDPIDESKKRNMKEAIQAYAGNAMAMKTAIERYFDESALNVEIVDYTFGNSWEVAWTFECEGEDFDYIDDDLLKAYITESRHFADVDLDVFSHKGKIEVKVVDTDPTEGKNLDEAYSDEDLDMDEADWIEKMKAERNAQIQARQAKRDAEAKAKADAERIARGDLTPEEKAKRKQQNLAKNWKLLEEYVADEYQQNCLESFVRDMAGDLADYFAFDNPYGYQPYGWRSGDYEIPLIPVSLGGVKVYTEEDEDGYELRDSFMGNFDYYSGKLTYYPVYEEESLNSDMTAEVGQTEADDFHSGVRNVADWKKYMIDGEAAFETTSDIHDTFDMDAELFACFQWKIFECLNTMLVAACIQAAKNDFNKAKELFIKTPYASKFRAATGSDFLFFEGTEALFPKEYLESKGFE